MSETERPERQRGDPTGPETMQRAREGDAAALESLVGALYSELRRRASGKISRERRGVSVGTTSLVDEAIMRVIRSGMQTVNDSQHFVNRACATMEHILVDRARRRKQTDRLDDTMEESVVDQSLRHVESTIGFPIDEFVSILARFAGEHPDLAELVRMRVYLRMPVKEVARQWNCDERTVLRRWKTAKALLSTELR